MGRWSGTEDCLRVESMVSNESMQNLPENGVKMGAAQYLKRVADKGGDFNGNLSYTDLWLQMTMKATVQIFGNDRITRIEIWNQETKQWISFFAVCRF